ncbi:anti_SigH_actin, anti-sigma factor, TIGR02949 family [Fimbriimonadaceae bacterium]
MNQLLTCAEVFERLQDYLDRELSAEEIAAVDAHLENCKNCAGDYRFEANVLRYVTQSLADVPVPVDLNDRLSSVVKAA